MTTERNRFTDHEPCKTPGCKFKYGFHICLKPEIIHLDVTDPAPVVKTNAKRYGKSDDHRRKLSEIGLQAYAEKRKANHEQDKRIIADYVENWLTIPEIADKYGSTKPSITSILNYYDVPIRRKGETRASLRLKNNLDQIIADYKNGMSRMQVAKKWEVAESSLSRALRDADVEMRPPHFINESNPRYTFN